MAGLFPVEERACYSDHQDTNQCCGLRSVHDRAWPFKDRDHGDNACEMQLGYHRSCLTPWRVQQQNVSWMIFAAAALIWATKVSHIRPLPHAS